MMTNAEFDQAMDRVFIVNDIDRRGVMATELMDEETGYRFKVETAGTTTKLSKWMPCQGRARVIATYRSPTREAARKKHYGIVGWVQREGSADMKPEEVI